MKRRTKLRGVLYRACLLAGKEILRHYRSGMRPNRNDSRVVKSWSSRIKDSRDPRTIVTSADIDSDRVLISELKRSGLNCAVLSEEGATLPIERNHRYRVIIDPLDGSKNFADGTLGLFGISVGVEEAGRLVAGAIYLPCFGEMLLSEVGEGTLLKRRVTGDHFRTIKLSRLSVLNRKVALSMARICVGRGSADPKVLTSGPVARLIRSCSEAVNFASCSVGLACVALGRIQGLVLSNQKYWDFAGGCAIFRELGMPFGIWRSRGGQPASEGSLGGPRGDSEYDIVAAATYPLFREIVGTLNGYNSRRDPETWKTFARRPRAR